MSNLPDRSRSPVRPMIGGNPALTRAHVAAAVFELERVARSLVPKGVRHTLHVLLGFLNKTSLECCPSQATLAEAVGAHRATIVRHLHVLEGVGLIARRSMPVGQGRRCRDSDWYSFDFALVGRPELVWMPSVVAKPRGRRPVRAADGTFRARVMVAASVQGESEAATLDGARKAQAAARFQDAILRSGFADRWFSVADAELEAAAILAEQNCLGGGLLVALRGLSGGV